MKPYFLISSYLLLGSAPPPHSPWAIPPSFDLGASTWLFRVKIFCFIYFAVTNPIDVIKIRMQLENELGSKHSSKNIFKDRYYKGFIRGGIRIFSEEGLRGLYKG